MKKSDLSRINSIKELEYEKEKLRLRIELAEEKINNNFNSLADRISIGSFSSLVKESALGIIYKAFSSGFNLFSRKKHNDD